MRIGAALLAIFLPGLAGAGSPPPPAAFFDGGYAVVGQGPDRGAPYSGSATIEATGEAEMKMTRRVGDAEIVETGRIEVPVHPPEGWMLKLYDREDTLVGGCLWQSDLDNYVRLTCLRGAADAESEMPGLEAWFPLH